MLFNFPSRYLFAIGLKTYLVLEVNVSQIPAPFPRYSTQDTLKVHFYFLYGTVTLLGIPFQKTSSDKSGLKESPSPHISILLLIRIQFELGCFQSLLLTASRLISFPAGTKMFQFPAFPYLEGINEKSH